MHVLFDIFDLRCQSFLHRLYEPHVRILVIKRFTLGILLTESFQRNDDEGFITAAVQRVCLNLT
jgi:hypothetical protein